MSNKTAEQIKKVCGEIEEMLLEKNRKYGDSALAPVRVFSKADPQEQIKVRIDDKISRMRNMQQDETEDVINDLIGYLILLKVAEREAASQTDVETKLGSGDSKQDDEAPQKKGEKNGESFQDLLLCEEILICEETLTLLDGTIVKAMKYDGTNHTQLMEWLAKKKAVGLTSSTDGTLVYNILDKKLFAYGSEVYPGDYLVIRASSASQVINPVEVIDCKRLSELVYGGNNGRIS